jgi:hypothetical protein
MPRARSLKHSPQRDGPRAPLLKKGVPFQPCFLRPTVSEGRFDKKAHKKVIVIWARDKICKLIQQFVFSSQALRVRNVVANTWVRLKQSDQLINCAGDHQFWRSTVLEINGSGDQRFWRSMVLVR